MNPFVIQPAVIAHPGRVYGIILARLVAINLLFPRTDNNIASSGATWADALCFFKKPNAHLKTEILRCQCADRTDVDGVQRVIIVEGFAGECSVGAIAA